MSSELKLTVTKSRSLSALDWRALVELCNCSYEEDLEALLETHRGGTHVIGRIGEDLVSYAMWVQRALQCRINPLLSTAYVEAVASPDDLDIKGSLSADWREMEPW